MLYRLRAKDEDLRGVIEEGIELAFYVGEAGVGATTWLQGREGFAHKMKILGFLQMYFE